MHTEQSNNKTERNQSVVTAMLARVAVMVTVTFGLKSRSSRGLSAIAERPHELGNFIRVGHFEATF